MHVGRHGVTHSIMLSFVLVIEVCYLGTYITYFIVIA